MLSVKLDKPAMARNINVPRRWCWEDKTSNLIKPQHAQVRPDIQYSKCGSNSAEFANSLHGADRYLNLLVLLPYSGGQGTKQIYSHPELLL